MKIATFNIQNLFHRDNELMKGPKGQNFQSWVDEFHALMGKSLRSDTDFDRLRELAFLLGFTSKSTEPYLVLRKRGGQLYVKPRGVALEERATAKIGWNGWVQVHSIPIDEKAVSHKVRIVADADPDILVLQEVEDRMSLSDFNGKLAEQYEITPYAQLLYLEGNSDQGLGMAVLAKNGYLVDSIKSHAHEKGRSDDPLFDIDCPEYSIITPKGESITVINGHFPEKDQGDTKETQRKAQAKRVAERYRKLLSKGREQVVVCGTLNDVSYSDALSPLLRDTHIKDISRHDEFQVIADKGTDGAYFRMGAYQKGVNIRQRDYLLCSPILFAKLESSGMDRRGIWPVEKPKWPTYPTVTSKTVQASDHPLLWAQFHGI